MRHETPRPIDPTSLADPVARMVIAAGAHLRAEFHRPGGPRRRGGKAVIDTEIEEMLRTWLTALHPCGWRGEETPSSDTRCGDAWVVDPQDGTDDFLAGRRGSAVSVALVRDGLPVLGAVYAPTAPDDAGDFFLWAQGGAVLRNGAPLAPLAVDRRPWDASVAVAMNGRAREYANANHGRLAPARLIAMPSVAYRLALAAAGDADVAASLTGGLDSWDIAGGHALLIGVGGVLADLSGRPIRHDGGGVFSGCVGGPQALVDEVVRRKPRMTSPERAAAPRVRRVPAAGPLRWAQGTLLGLLAGDALGAQVEFMGPTAIAGRFPDGVRDMADGGTHDTLAGQPTDDGEMALLLARSLVKKNGFDRASVAAAYVRWRDSQPFDMGHTTRAGIDALSGRGRPNMASQANGALMRVAPIGILAAGQPELAARLAGEEAGLTHPHPVCRAASAAFAAAIAAGVAGADAHSMWSVGHANAGEDDTGETVRACLGAGLAGPPADFMHNGGWVLTALQNAFHRLWIGQPLETALIETVAAGGDTDTNAAICGALLGAAQGLPAIPLRWRRAVLGCRPVRAAGARRPRPSACWPDDALDLVEALLTATQPRMARR